jgi:hypothetical protein
MGIRDTVESVGLGVVMLAVLAILLVVNTLPGLFVPSSKAVDAMRAFGYRNVIVVNEHRLAPRLFGGCGSDASAGFDVDVVDAAGQTQHFVVCCGVIGECLMHTRWN